MVTPSHLRRTVAPAVVLGTRPPRVARRARGGRAFARVIVLAAVVGVLVAVLLVAPASSGAGELLVGAVAFGSTLLGAGAVVLVRRLRRSRTR